MGLAVISINRSKRFMRLEDGRTIPIVSMLGGDGEEVDDLSECVIALVELPDGMFTGVAMAHFTPEYDEHLN